MSSHSPGASSSDEPSSEPSLDDDAVRLGDRLRGRFHVMAELGRGGMGVVYEAFDLERGGPVALKVLSSRGSDAASIARLKREFRTLADLKHPNLVRLGELFGDSRPWFFTMERIEGVDLLRWVRAESGRGERSALASLGDATLVDPPTSTPIEPASASAGSGSSERSEEQPRIRASSDERRLRAALAQLVDAIGALHAAGHVHRDLKPSNVLVTPEGKVVLIDFGISRPRIAQHGAHDPLEGTPAYMAPEQWLARNTGPAADWYALGVILYEALAGQLPVDGSVRDMLLAKRAGFTRVPTSGWLAPDLERLTLRLLAPEPADRPDADEIRAVLAAGTRPVSLALAERLRPPAPHFVGRSGELAQLWRAFEHSRRGAAAIVRVVGESGVGKTALVDQFVDAVAHAEDDAVVLRGRCYENELVPYKAWDSLVDALARHLVTLDERQPGALAAILPPDLHGLTRLFPALDAVAALVPERDTGDRRLPLGPERQRQRSFEDLRELFRGLSRLGPLVLTIDDWQWADHDSAQLLDALLHEPGSPRLLLVITERPRRDAQPGAGTTIVLGPLGRDETARLAEALSSDAHSAGAIATLARESGGHPMFLQQLVHWSLGARESQRLDDLILARARALEADARRVLELLCIAGGPLSRALVEAAAALPRARCAQVIDDLEAEKLVRATGVLRLVLSKNATVY